MKTLGEIIRAVKTGGETTHKECLYAVAAMQSLSTFDSIDFREALRREKFKLPVEIYAENNFLRWKAALARGPKEWLGPEHDPMIKENQQRVKEINRR